MLPDVATKDRLLAVHERGVLIRGGSHLDAAVGVGHEPRPAAAEPGRTGGFELRLKFSKATTRGIDRISQRATWFTATVWAHHCPEERVIGVAATVVAHRATDVLRHGVQIAHQVLNGFALKLSVAGDGVVELGDVGVVMLAVVDFHGLCINVRLQRIVRVREVR